MLNQKVELSKLKDNQTISFKTGKIGPVKAILRVVKPANLGRHAQYLKEGIPNQVIFLATFESAKIVGHLINGEIVHAHIKGRVENNDVKAYYYEDGKLKVCNDIKLGTGTWKDDGEVDDLLGGHLDCKTEHEIFFKRYLENDESSPIFGLIDNNFDVVEPKIKLPEQVDVTLDVVNVEQLS